LIGSFIVKVVPLFGAVLNVIDPLWLFRMVFVIVSPRPVPFPSFLVVKKGSKMCSRIVGFIPDPVSVMVISMYFSCLCLDLLVVMVISPWVSIASEALMHRFVMTW